MNPVMAFDRSQTNQVNARRRIIWRTSLALYVAWRKQRCVALRAFEFEFVGQISPKKIPGRAGANACQRCEMFPQAKKRSRGFQRLLASMLLVGLSCSDFSSKRQIADLREHHSLVRQKVANAGGKARPRIAPCRCIDRERPGHHGRQNTLGQLVPRWTQHLPPRSCQIRPKQSAAAWGRDPPCHNPLHRRN